MALSYGFYNSINKDRLYNATQLSQIFDGIINDGIYMSVLNHFQVRASGEGMSVLVGGGRAWFNHTWTYNDSDLLLSIDESEIVGDRIDAIVIKIDARDTVRANSIEIIKGVVSESTPVKPEIVDGQGYFYHPLAYITIASGITEITDSMIENAIGVDERTPFVTGIIETISATELIQQWQTEWNEWNDEHRQAYLDWVSEQESDMESWTTTQKEAFLEWMASEKTEFDDWFENLHYVLDGDVAGHLQNEIDDIDEEIFKRYYDLCTKNTVYNRDDKGNIIGWSSQGEGVSLSVSITKNDENITVTNIVNDGKYVWTKTDVLNGNNLSETYTKEAIGI